MGKLRFGGPMLQKGEVTWYDHINETGNLGGVVFVRPGQEVDEARVKNADHYVNSGRATRITDVAEAAKV